VEERYGVRVVHVKVSDTAEVVSRVLTEKAAGRSEHGAVDLVWINGENFAAMKRQGLLLPAAWSTKLPNYRFVDVDGKPTVAHDFTVPVDGLEAPWGMARLVFFDDTARLKNPPTSASELAEWISKNPGRFTYPQPPDFIGTTFLKQLLVELAPDNAVLAEPATDASFDVVSKPLFDWLDAAHPNLWRGGRAFPRDYGNLRRLLAEILPTRRARSRTASFPTPCGALSSRAARSATRISSRSRSMRTPRPVRWCSRTS
jgi:putative thiamine transport system substrate-binding protein